MNKMYIEVVFRSCNGHSCSLVCGMTNCVGNGIRPCSLISIVRILFQVEVFIDASLTYVYGIGQTMTKGHVMITYKKIVRAL